MTKVCWIGFGAVVLVALVCTPTPALACRCMNRDVDKAAAEAESVFVGHVVGVDDRGAAIFEVEHVFKGEPAETFAFGQAQTSCDMFPQMDERWLIFGPAPGTGEPIDKCHGSRRLETRTDEEREQSDEIIEQVVDVLGEGTEVTLSGPSRRRRVLPPGLGPALLDADRAAVEALLGADSIVDDDQGRTVYDDVVWVRYTADDRVEDVSLGIPKDLLCVEVADWAGFPDAPKRVGEAWWSDCGWERGEPLAEGVEGRIEHGISVLHLTRRAAP